MIAETTGLVFFLAIVIYFVWRISIRNRSLYESPIFRTFVPIVVLPVIAVYVVIVVLQWNPVMSLTGIGSLTGISLLGAYLLMPFSSTHFLAHLKIVGYNIASKGAWIRLTYGVEKIIGCVVSLKTTAVTLRDEEGVLHIIENQTFLDGKPQRLETTQNADGSIENMYLYRVNVELPWKDGLDPMKLKQQLKTYIVKKQLSLWSVDETGEKGEAVNSATMTGFVHGGTHYAPRVYYDLVVSMGFQVVKLGVLIPCLNYYEGWSKWHSFIPKLARQCYEEQ